MDVPAIVLASSGRSSGKTFSGIDICGLSQLYCISEGGYDNLMVIQMINKKKERKRDLLFLKALISRILFLAFLERKKGQGRYFGMVVPAHAPAISFDFSV